MSIMTQKTLYIQKLPKRTWPKNCSVIRQYIFTKRKNMKQIPKIEKFMSPMPHTINSEVGLNSAKDLMREFGVRHLPVQKAGRLVGVLTDRDLKLASTFDKTGDFSVEDAMTPDPFTVDPSEPLNDVVKHMAEKKYGCAVVAQTNGKVVGIFTATDGLRAFAEILESNYKPITQ